MKTAIQSELQQVLVVSVCNSYVAILGRAHMAIRLAFAVGEVLAYSLFDVLRGKQSSGSEYAARDERAGWREMQRHSDRMLSAT